MAAIGVFTLIFRLLNDGFVLLNIHDDSRDTHVFTTLLLPNSEISKTIFPYLQYYGSMMMTF